MQQKRIPKLKRGLMSESRTFKPLGYPYILKEVFIYFRQNIVTFINRQKRAINSS